MGDEGLDRGEGGGGPRDVPDVAGAHDDGTDATPPADLLAAQARYERALGEDDLAVLDELFAPGLLTSRAQGGEVLVGHGEISAYRAERGGAPARWVRQVHVRLLGDDLAVTTTETERRDGGSGVQTQVWQRPPDGGTGDGRDGRSEDGDGTGRAWRVVAAHVSGGPPAAPLEPLLDGAVWSVAPTDDGALVAGAQDGPLAWVRVAVKDVVAVVGHRVGGGVPAWLAQAPRQETSAPALQRLLDAGADVVGIAQTDELAYSLAGRNRHYGTPDNPAAPGRTTGGSTSGPAAAVASGAADLGLGTDTAGSLRVPGSFCGLYALRPSHGAVPTEGVLPLAPSFDTVGLLARDGRLLHAAAPVLLGASPGGAAAPGKAHAGRGTARLLRSVVLDALAEPATRLAVGAAATAVAVQTGLPVEVVDGEALPGDDVARWAEAFRLVQAAEAWRSHGSFVTASPGALDPVVEARFRVGEALSAEEEQEASAVLDDARARLGALLEDGGVLCLPSTSGPALLVGADDEQVQAARAATLRLTCLASIGGLPALGLPWGHVGELPVGVCLVAGPGRDADLLALLDELVPPREVPL